MLATQQGGYNFRSISKSALAVTKTLMGEPPDRLLKLSPTTAAEETVGRVMGIQAQHWRCMFPKPPKNPVWADRLHGMDTRRPPGGPKLTGTSDVIRDYQSQQLYTEFKLIPLYIYRTAISKSFKNQVLAR